MLVDIRGKMFLGRGKVGTHTIIHIAVTFSGHGTTFERTLGLNFIMDMQPVVLLKEYVFTYFGELKSYMWLLIHFYYRLFSTQ